MSNLIESTAWFCSENTCREAGRAREILEKMSLWKDLGEFDLVAVV